MILLAVIEDNVQYRKMLELMLKEDTDIHLAHSLDRAENIGKAFEESLPDVVIMDIDLPGKNGIEATWEIKQKWPGIRILMLTVFEDADKIFNALRAGANGYLLKKDSPAKIREAIEAVAKGESPINSIIAGKLLHFFRQNRQSPMDEYHLTQREKEILQHLVNGLSYKEIASLCHITFQTLNSHTKNIYLKLNVHSRAELAARYGPLL